MQAQKGEIREKAQNSRPATSSNRRDGCPGTGYAGGSASAVDFLSVPEEQGDAPDAGQRDDGVDDAGKDGSLTAADPRHDVKAEKSDGTPVERADDDEDQSDSINHVTETPFV